MHTDAFISLTAPQKTGEPKRALVLPGGGLRLSYQAGILMALEEAGMAFQFMDGTSGGSLNLSMLLSGLSPEEISQRWRTLRMMDTISFLPLEDYLKAELKADSLGLSLIGVFHSHPDCANIPSEYDREWAQPFFSYIITRVDQGKAVNSRSWRLLEDRSKYEEEEIEIQETPLVE